MYINSFSFFSVVSVLFLSNAFGYTINDSSDFKKKLQFQSVLDSILSKNDFYADSLTTTYYSFDLSEQMFVDYEMNSGLCTDYLFFYPLINHYLTEEDFILQTSNLETTDDYNFFLMDNDIRVSLFHIKESQKHRVMIQKSIDFAVDWLNSNAVYFYSNNRLFLYYNLYCQKSLSSYYLRSYEYLSDRKIKEEMIIIDNEIRTITKYYNY